MKPILSSFLVEYHCLPVQLLSQFCIRITLLFVRLCVAGHLISRETLVKATHIYTDQDLLQREHIAPCSEITQERR